MKVGGTKQQPKNETIWPARLNFFLFYKFWIWSLNTRIRLFQKCFLMITPGKGEMKMGCQNIYFLIDKNQNMAGGRKWPDLYPCAQAEIITFFPELTYFWVLHGPVKTK